MPSKFRFGYQSTSKRPMTPCCQRIENPFEKTKKRDEKKTGVSLNLKAPKGKIPFLLTCSLSDKAKEKPLWTSETKSSSGLSHSFQKYKKLLLALFASFLHCHETHKDDSCYFTLQDVIVDEQCLSLAIWKLGC